MDNIITVSPQLYIKNTNHVYQITFSLTNIGLSGVHDTASELERMDKFRQLPVAKVTMVEFLTFLTRTSKEPYYDFAFRFSIYESSLDQNSLFTDTNQVPRGSRTVDQLLGRQPFYLS